MASRTQRPTVAEAIGKHRAAANLSYYALAVELVPLLPSRFRPAPEKLRRMEAGLVPDDEMDPIVLAALAQVFGVPVSELSPAAAIQLTALRPLLGPPKRKSGCFAASAGRVAVAVA